MMATEQNYLHVSFRDFREVIEKKYNRPFDLPAIEKAVKPLRRETPLSCSDIQQFESPQNWWFEKFWVFPPEHKLTAELKRRKFNFWRLPNKENEVIRSLYEVFKSIELVSILLRFIQPDHYGIISPPVERILDVRRGRDAVETYLNYLADLRAIKAYCHFKRVADVDMALWVVHERCYGNPVDSDIQNAYFNDRFVLRLRVKNSISHFLVRYSYGEIAHALLPVNAELAGQIGGIEFEKKIRELAKGKIKTNIDNLELEELIDLLQENGVDQLTTGRWHAARRTRNRAVHGSNKLGLKEINDLLKIIDEIGDGGK